MADLFDPTTTLFAEVLLPVPIPKLFTYRIPAVMASQAQTGQRVIVQFGDRKVLTGLIVSVHSQAPHTYEAKYLLEILDQFPSVSELQYKLFQWIAEYYCCTVGEVMNAALPSGLKLSSESMVQLNPAFNREESEFHFSEKEDMLLKRLQQEAMPYSEITKFLGVKTLYSILKSLVSKEAILLFEEVKEKYKPKKIHKIRLTSAYLDHHSLETLFQTLGSKPKQEAVVLKYLQEVHIIQHPEDNKAGINRDQLLSGDISPSSLETLIKHNVFEEFDVVVSRFGEEDLDHTPRTITLSQEQQQAQTSLLEGFTNHNIALLHGITGSGKTEIYINLIQRALDGGTQVLYLLPEIALTTQIVQRLKRVFGNTLGIYHSRFSDNERVEVWNGVLTGKFKFVVGVRSSVMLPFDNLGLIIVDEEHDPSYKQHEPAPRYHARDVAIMMGHFHHAKVLLGSATPAVETFYQAMQGKYHYVKLDKRFGEAKLPTILLADMARERKLKTNKGEFSGLLIKQLEDTLSKKEQAIIFQNRRGYSPMVNCEDCEWIPKCINCAVSLTYHQYKNALVCHYCGYKETLPKQCPSCSSTRLTTVGYGTEKIEEELTLYFPGTSIQRMDLDTTRTKNGYETIIQQFEDGLTDVLVGTQMVTKGLDFDKVSLVGIFNADRMIHFPDFRSYERAFQLITQVSGRAGRKEKPGTVVIQTGSADHPLLQLIIHHQVEEFYKRELNDRQQNNYPPFTRLIDLTIKHPDKKISQQAAHELANVLRNKLGGVRILGPGEPMVSKIRNLYLMNLLIKIPRNQIQLGLIKQHLTESILQLQQQKDFKTVRVVVDVDPI